MANKKTQRTSRQMRRGSAPKLKMSTRRSTGRRSLREPEFGGMTVREAGRKGGLIGGRKGGLAVRARQVRARLLRGDRPQGRRDGQSGAGPELLRADRQEGRRHGQGGAGCRLLRANRQEGRRRR